MSQSLWQATAGKELRRPALQSDLDVDFAVIGGGYSGLWTAYWLKRLEPTAKVALIERDHVGFGASGRNGGWFSALFPASMDKLAKWASRDDAIAQQRAMNDIVEETEHLLAVEDIDCDWQRGGTVSVTRTKVQQVRAREELQWWRDWGFDESDQRWLDADEACGRLGATNVLGGTYTPHCARVHPLKLARGLAHAAERHGVQIFEATAAVNFTDGVVRTSTGHRIHAGQVVLATEAYTSQFQGRKRDIVPVYSLMVASPVLSDAEWQQIGLAQGETFADYRHLIIYGQRTADNRLAFGGRGAPYHFGSSISPRYDQDPMTHAMIWRELVELFPFLRDRFPDYTWGGPLGIPRDWSASVGVGPEGVAHTGGYVGDGLGTSALGGKTLAELLTERDTPRTRLPWVGHQSRKWEAEPLRWLGVNLGLRGMTLADHEERLTGRPSAIANLFNRTLRS